MRASEPFAKWMMRLESLMHVASERRGAVPQMLYRDEISRQYLIQLLVETQDGQTITQTPASNNYELRRTHLLRGCVVVVAGAHVVVPELKPLPCNKDSADAEQSLLP